MRSTINLKLSALLIFIFIGCGGESKEKIIPLSMSIPSHKNTIQALGEYIEANTTGEVLSYEWKEDEKLLSTNKIFNTQQLTGGEHNITLTIKNSKGETKSDSILLRVYFMLKERRYAGVSDRLNHKYTVVLPTIFSEETEYLHTYSYNKDRMYQQITKLESTEATSTYNFNYDETLNLIEISNSHPIHTYSYHTNGTMKSYVQEESKYSYDEFNNLLKFHRKDKLLIDFTYDKNNNIISKRVDEQDDGSIDKTDIFTYDKDSNLLIHSNDYNEGETRTYIYDEQGNKTTSTYKNKEHKVVETWIYNKEGKLIKTQIDINNKFSTKVTYNYRDSNKIITKTMYKNTGTTIKSITVYDDNKNLLKETTDGDDVTSFDGVADYTHTYTYDSNNNLIKDKLEDENSVLHEHTFINSYDKHNTLIKLEKNGVVQFEKSLKI